MHFIRTLHIYDRDSHSALDDDRVLGAMTHWEIKRTIDLSE